MTKKVDIIVGFIKKIEYILEEEKTNSNKPENNVVYLDLGIGPEFKKLQTTKLKLPEVLAVFHDWAERTHFMAIKNKGRLKAGRIRKIVEANLAQVEAIQKILTKIK